MLPICVPSGSPEEELPGRRVVITGWGKVRPVLGHMVQVRQLMERVRRQVDRMSEEKGGLREAQVKDGHSMVSHDVACHGMIWHLLT